jgi:hypothetical protein
MTIRGSQEQEMVSVLSAKERATINRLLKKMTLHVEATSPPGKPS